MPFVETLLTTVLLAKTSVPRVMPASLEITRGITFASRGRIELQLDVIRSKRVDFRRPAPAILFFHGGAWRDGRRDAPNPIAWELAQRGYVCIQADYRLSQEEVFPAQLHDARAAVRWVKENADAWGVDGSKIGVWGMSAGGHLALLTAYAPEILLEANTQPIRVQAVAAIMPTTDVLSIYRFRLTQRNVRADLIGAASPEAQLLGGNPETLAAQARLASPIHHVSPDDPPTWLVHGIKDETVPYQQSQSLLSVLTRQKVRSQLILLSGLGHEARWDAFQDGVVTFFERELGPVARDAGQNRVDFAEASGPSGR